MNLSKLLRNDIAKIVFTDLRIIFGFVVLLLIGVVIFSQFVMKDEIMSIVFTGFTILYFIVLIVLVIMKEEQ